MAERCKICTRERAEHGQAEAEGLIHHKFSVNGELNQVDPPKPKSQKPPGLQLSPDNAMAGRLAVVLNRNGLLSEEDLVYVLSGQSPPGERGSIGEDPADRGATATG